MKKWIQGAIKHPGALHEELGIPKGQKIPASTLETASHAKGKLGQRARFAMTMKHMSSPWMGVKPKKQGDTY